MATRAAADRAGCGRGVANMKSVCGVGRYTTAPLRGPCAASVPPPSSSMNTSDSGVTTSRSRRRHLPLLRPEQALRRRVRACILLHQAVEVRHGGGVRGRTNRPHAAKSSGCRPGTVRRTVLLPAMFGPVSRPTTDRRRRCHGMRQFDIGCILAADFGRPGRRVSSARLGGCRPRASHGARAATTRLTDRRKGGRRADPHIRVQRTHTRGAPTPRRPATASEVVGVGGALLSVSNSAPPVGDFLPPPVHEVGGTPASVAARAFAADT